MVAAKAAEANRKNGFLGPISGSSFRTINWPRTGLHGSFLLGVAALVVVNIFQPCCVHAARTYSLRLEEDINVAHATK